MIKTSSITSLFLISSVKNSFRLSFSIFEMSTGQQQVSVEGDFVSDPPASASSFSAPLSLNPNSSLPQTSPLYACFWLQPPVPPSFRVFSNESTFHMRWPKYWSLSFNISPSNEHSGLISFRMDWLDLLAVQGTLKSLLQHHSSKASILQCSAFFGGSDGKASVYNAGDLGSSPGLGRSPGEENGNPL